MNASRGTDDDDLVVRHTHHVFGGKHLPHLFAVDHVTPPPPPCHDGRREDRVNEISIRLPVVHRTDEFCSFSLICLAVERRSEPADCGRVDGWTDEFSSF